MAGADEHHGLRFRVLGPLEIWSDGRRIPAGGGLRTHLLSLLLIESGRVVPIDRLVDACWDIRAPATAQHQVRKAVSALRGALPGGRDLIRTDGTGYLMDVAEDQLDLSRFRIRIERGGQAEAAGMPDNAVTQYQAALDLWRGRALDGVVSRLLIDAATVLEELRFSVLEKLVGLHISLGRARDVVDVLKALALEHPLHEAVRGRLMLALHLSGRKAEALEEYAKLSRALREELGIDPGMECVLLHERILRDDQGLTPAPARAAAQPSPAEPAPDIVPGTVKPSSIPYRLPDFVGRREEISWLLDAADRVEGWPGPGVVCIDGMGGTGKTTLMFHVAHTLADRYRDGLLHVDLLGFTAGREPLRPEAALYTLLRTMGVPGKRIPDDLAGRSMLWHSIASSRKVLLLLDNADTAEQVRSLIPQARDCLVLLTSRPRIAGMDGALAVTLGQFSPDDGLELLSAMLGRGRTVAEPEAAAELIQLCGGLPLAIRIAAARLLNRPHWTLGSIVTRLRRESDRLDHLAEGDRSVAAAIGPSYRSLGTVERELFRLLGGHPGSDFDVDAIVALSGMSAASAETALEKLVDARLLVMFSAERYMFHGLVRDYARRLLGTPQHAAEERQAMRRLLDYYLFKAVAAAEALQPGRQRVDLGLKPSRDLPPLDIGEVGDALAWFDAERLNLVEAARYASRNGLARHAAHLPRALAPYLELRGHIDEELELFELAAQVSHRLGDKDLERLSLMNLSSPYWSVGRIRDGLDCARRALVLTEELHDRHGEADCLGKMGIHHNALGEYAEGLSCHERALALHGELGSRRGERISLVSLSSAMAVLGRDEEALAHAERAVAISRELDDLGGEMMGLVNAANARIHLGETAAAQAGLDAAAALLDRIDSSDSRTLILARRADLALCLGRVDEALRLAQQALDLVLVSHRPVRIAMVENLLGAIYLAAREPQIAAEHYRNARAVAERVEFRIETARAVHGMARACAARGDIGTAAGLWKDALVHFEAMGVPESEAVRSELARAMPEPTRPPT